MKLNTLTNQKSILRGERTGLRTLLLTARALLLQSMKRQRKTTTPSTDYGYPLLHLTCFLPYRFFHLTPVSRLPAGLLLSFQLWSSKVRELKQPPNSQWKVKVDSPSLTDDSRQSSTGAYRCRLTNAYRCEYSIPSPDWLLLPGRSSIPLTRLESSFLSGAGLAL